MFIGDGLGGFGSRNVERKIRDTLHCLGVIVRLRGGRIAVVQAEKDQGGEVDGESGGFE